MKLLSITVGNQTGELQVIGEADVARRKTTFKALVNGMTVAESEDFGEAREVIMNIFQLNKSIKERAN
jgi:hypothetical protein